MLKVEEWLSIREMAKQGVSISEIGRRTGRDRRTVRKVLAEAAPEVHRRIERPRVSKLEPFRDYLIRRLEEGCGNAVVLMEEIGRQGYSGKISILRGFLGAIKQDLAHKEEATKRFETAPGKQAQADWGEFGRIWDASEGCWKKLYAFVFTLAYSRAIYLEFTTSADMEHFLGCHLNAFAALGIPETVLYDNLKTAILGRRLDGSPIFPGRFLDFALYYGFTPRFCQPYRARTKGKVERTIGYVRGNFFVRVAPELRVRELDLAGLNERAGRWVAEVANLRVHGTHGEVVSERLAREIPLLGRIDVRPRYEVAYRSLRRVSRDGRFSYRGSLYQVGVRHSMRELWVDESLDGKLKVHSREGAVVHYEPVVEDEAAAVLSRPRGEEKHEAGGAVLRFPAREVLVQTRDLSVYEEVARAADLS